MRLSDIFKKKAHSYQIQRLLAVTFFFIIFVYFILIFMLVFLFRRIGITRHSIFGPAFATYAIIILCVILAFATYHYILRKILTPLKQLSDATKQIAKGKYDITLHYNGQIEELENAINNFNQMAKEIHSVEMIRNDFIANVSHEFKTPLSSIMGYITLLQDSELTEEERKEYIRKVFFNIEKLNDLTENILRLSKLESQNQPNALTTYRLDEQIREAVVLLEPKWSAKKIELDIQLSEIMYTGVQPLLFQVWVNLISNAIKFSNVGGRITISLKMKKGWIRIWVNDEGIGMSQETQKHIFDKFYQGDTSRRSQGNGLGLALCKEILHVCNGKIYVTSELGQGSTFMVELRE